MLVRSNDHPNVITFPPLIIVATLVLSALLQWLAPFALPASIDPGWRIAIGAAAFAAGAAICVIARTTLVRRGTNVNPQLPTTAMATEGIYRQTRNPIYVGGTLAMIGVGLMFGLTWLAPLLVPSVLTLHFGVVRREERYLEAKFGDEYRRYRAQVPRYLIAI
jgi:protein-S-isoprenylcysteine O-methyltransferase Ste14